MVGFIILYIVSIAGGLGCLVASGMMFRDINAKNASNVTDTIVIATGFPSAVAVGLFAIGVYITAETYHGKDSPMVGAVALTAIAATILVMCFIALGRKTTQQQ